MHFKDLTNALGVAAALCALISPPAMASQLAEDASAGVVYSYASITPESDDGTLSLESFTAQINELADDDYRVIALPDLITDGTLPRRSVALSFDQIDRTFFETIAPLLLEKNLPFTIFVSPGQFEDPLWDDLRKLASNPLVTLGLSAYGTGRASERSPAQLTEDLNRVRAKFREELGADARYFAYPHGEWTPAYRDLIDRQGFAAAFSQNSGVIYSGADRLSLPRFTMTEDVADLDRLRMTSQALPFPVRDLEPASMLLEANPPFPGFTVAAGISASDLEKLTCFASGLGELKVQRLGNNRIEIRFPRGFDDTRGRVNCTLPVPGADDPHDIRWRWLGFLYTIPPSLVAESQ